MTARMLPLVLCSLVLTLGNTKVLAAEKVRVMKSGPGAGHYLEWNGNPILLIGDSVTQGWMETGPNFDTTGYVDALASRGMNTLMIWSFFGTSAALQQGDTRIAYDAPEYWPWVGSPDDQSFDLTTLNQTYFDALKDLAAYAETKNIVLLICVHDGWTKTRFDGHPFNAALGNGPLTASTQYVYLADYDNEMPATYNPSWSRQEKNQYFQERLCDKMISELSPYSNVIYEMFNEGRWYDNEPRRLHEQHFLSFFRARCDNLLLTNTDEIIGDDPHNDSKVDVVTLHGDWTDRFNDFQTGFNTLPARPYLLSEPVPGWDGTNHTIPTILQSVWETTLAGAGWVNQNDPSFGWDPQAAIVSQASVRDQAYDIQGHCARFFNTSEVDFHTMRPLGELSSTGMCSANEGVEYVVLALNGGNFTVDLTAATSTDVFWVKWYNPMTGKTTRTDPVRGGEIVSLNAPDSNPWVVHLKNAPPRPRKLRIEKVNNNQ